MSTYYNFKVLKVNVLIICFLVMFSVIITAKAFATDYYIDKAAGSNSDDGLSQTDAWATFKHAMTQLSAGDTLYLMDGTFTERLRITVSGTSGNRITFKALNDGQATVDVLNRSSTEALDINTHSNINIEGIIFKNGNGWKGRTAYIGNCTDITVKRCSFYDDTASSTDLATVVLYNNKPTAYANAVILEDCAVSGRWGMINTHRSQYIIIRRCWLRGDYGGIYLYHANNALVENTIDTTNPASANFHRPGNGPHTNTLKRGNYNRLFGNICWSPSDSTVPEYTGMQISVRSPYYQTTGNHFKDCVSIDTQYYGAKIEGDSNLTIENVTVVWDNNESANIAGLYFRKRDPGVILNAIVKNSSLLSNGNAIGIHKSNADTITNTYNNIYNFNNNYTGITQGTGEIFVNPNYDIATYGNGAYLMIPQALQGKGEGGGDIGAEILYQYKDRVLTNVPLWPWPMEDRIFAETGISVTWKANGGLWKTLDGVYSGGQVSPASPTGLAIQ